MKKFDLNIEKILENWDIKHAVREIIANALDEQKLTNTEEIEIVKQTESNSWVIRDFGRGLKYEHFTQKENDEKLNAEGIIGKFGIGLKDALATFDRNGIIVQILSKHGDITLGKNQKNGFDDLITLHAYISEPSNPRLKGTEFHLKNISDEDVEAGKKLFLKFNNEVIIESTKHGSVLRKAEIVGNIYINGVLVASEENFLFSYNVTLLNPTIKKAINRERTNISRTAYSNSVKSILLACRSEEVANELMNDIKQFRHGDIHDELIWIDIQYHAIKILHEKRSIICITADSRTEETDLIHEAEASGAEIIYVSTKLLNKITIENQSVSKEHVIRTLLVFVKERSENFDFKIIDENDLTEFEKQVFLKKDIVFKVLGGKPSIIKSIVVSETMQKDIVTFSQTNGLWEPNNQRVVIWRPILKDEEKYLGVLLHEIAHAISGATDETRKFESELTRLLGVFSKHAISDI